MNETNVSREVACRLLQPNLQALQGRLNGIIGGESRDDHQPEGLVVLVTGNSRPSSGGTEREKACWIMKEGREEWNEYGAD